jgi:hypothetical protein
MEILISEITTLRIKMKAMDGERRTPGLTKSSSQQ